MAHYVFTTSKTWLQHTAECNSQQSWSVKKTKQNIHCILTYCRTTLKQIPLKQALNMNFLNLSAAFWERCYAHLVSEAFCFAILKMNVPATLNRPVTLAVLLSFHTSADNAWRWKEISVTCASALLNITVWIVGAYKRMCCDWLGTA